MFIDWLLYYFVSRLSLHCSGFCFMVCSHVTSWDHRTVFFNQSFSFQRSLSCPSEFRRRPSPITMSEVAFLFAYMIYVNFSREHGPPPITLSEVVYPEEPPPTWWSQTLTQDSRERTRLPCSHTERRWQHLLSSDMDSMVTSVCVFTEW